MGLPLAGLLVVAFEQAVAAPLCSRHLGDLGARVIKVEQRIGGDFARSYDDSVRGMASHFVWLNRNKESITLDLKHPSAGEVVERLIGSADVMVQNLAPGAASRLGIGATEVVARFPRLIAVDISGYGVGGPYDEKRAYDLLVQAEAGACSITGTPGAPAKAGPPIADAGAGLYSLSAILAALYARERTGVGSALAVSMFDVVAEWMGFVLQHTMHTGQERQPNGMSAPMVSPYGAYPTRDSKTVVLGTTNDREWQRLAELLIDRPDLATAEKYATNAARCDARAEIDDAISAWTLRHDLDQILVLADLAGIGNARYNTVRDVLVHPQLEQRHRWRQVDSPVGPLRCLLAPPNCDQWEQQMGPIPGLGEHTNRVLGELGYSVSQVAGLRADAVI